MSGIRIHKLVTKGLGNEAQTILVIGSAKASDVRPMWVGIGRTEDFQTNCTPPWMQRATKIDLNSLAHGITDKGELTDKPDKPFHDTHLEPDEWCWMARFDFSDGGSFDGIWQRFIARPASDNATFRVVAGSGSEEGNAPDWSRFAIVNENGQSSCNPEFAYRDFAFKDVEGIVLFEVGVLFIHGIGNHKRNETLIKFGEPLVKFIEQWFAATSKSGAEQTPRKKREQIWLDYRNLDFGVLMSRQDLDGPQILIDKFKDEKGHATESTADGILCACLRAEHTPLASAGSEMPGSTLVRLSAVADHGLQFRESHLLLSESYWTDKTVYPSVGDLTDWIWKVFPVALQTYIHVILASSIEDCKCEFKNTFEGKKPLRLRLESLIRVDLNIVILMAKVSLTPLIMMLGIVAQTTLSLLGLLSLTPIQWVRRLAASLVEILMGTVGQSYALKTSVVRASAMTSEVAKNLAWMSEKCQRIVIVSHSQGAEVARQVLRSAYWPKVCRWITLGSGIVPLTLLGDDSHAKGSAKLFYWLMLALTSTTVMALAFWVLARQNAAMGNVFSSLVAWGRSINFLKLVIFLFDTYILFAVVVSFLAMLGLRPAKLRVPARVVKVWRNYFGSHDPVSGGLAFQPGFKLNNEQRIFNARSTLQDHTTYFENWEQFLAPVVMDILEWTGIARSATNNANGQLSRGNARRERLTWYTMVLRYGLILCLAYAIYSGLFGNWQRFLGAFREVIKARSLGSLSTLLLYLKNALIIAAVYFLLMNKLFRKVQDHLQKVLVRDLATVLTHEHHTPATTPTEQAAQSVSA